jgi:hypothetical protein
MFRLRAENWENRVKCPNWERYLIYNHDIRPETSFHSRSPVLVEQRDELLQNHSTPWFIRLNLIGQNTPCGSHRTTQKYTCPTLSSEIPVLRLVYFQLDRLYLVGNFMKWLENATKRCATMKANHFDENWYRRSVLAVMHFEAPAH